MEYIIEPLGPQHDCGAFCCGNDDIDKWFARALKEHNRYKVRVHVIRAEDSLVVLGFYSLCLFSLESGKFLGLKKFGTRRIPAVYLAMLGRDKSQKGNGLGEKLMSHAIESAYKISRLAGLYCLTLDAVNEDKLKYYEDLGFVRIEPDGLSMFMPITAIVDLIEGTATD